MRRDGDYIVIDVNLLRAIAWIGAGPVIGLSILLLSKIIGQ